MICLLFASDVIPGKHNQTAYRVLNFDTQSRNNICIMISVEIGS